MKKYLFILIIVLAAGPILEAQSTDPLVTTCLADAGPGAKYLKDFRVQLGQSAAPGELRYKAQMSLWKNTKYRFSLCNGAESKGKLILSIKDDANKTVISSYDPKTGKTYSFVEFICNKSGIYQLNYDFYDGIAGMGVGVVSMVR